MEKKETVYPKVYRVEAVASRLEAIAIRLVLQFVTFT